MWRDLATQNANGIFRFVGRAKARMRHARRNKTGHWRARFRFARPTRATGVPFVLTKNVPNGIFSDQYLSAPGLILSDIRNPVIFIEGFAAICSIGPAS
jgi:hypothetical protein